MKNLKKLFFAATILLIGFSAQAQQVNTLYFLENSPMRHYINPAFQPISKVYVSLPVIGWFSGDVSLGISVNDFLYRKTIDGEKQVVTAFYDETTRNKLYNHLRKGTLMGTDVQVNLLNFGFRIKEAGYFHFTVNEHIEAGATTPKGLWKFMLQGGMNDLEVGGNNHYDLRQLGAEASLYTEIGGGYSHKINDEWTVGGKVKALLGQAYVGMYNKNLAMDLSVDQWRIKGKGDMMIAGPIDVSLLPAQINYDDFEKIKFKELFPNMSEVSTYLKPNGGGVSFDLGMTYKPHPMVQITASVTDLGFIVWNKGKKYSYQLDSVYYDGIPEFSYSKYVYAKDGEKEKFHGDSLMNDVLNEMKSKINDVTTTSTNDHFARMTSAKINIGVDANFWDNRVGVGIYSRTRFFNHRVYEEVTLGAAFRPVHWFNIALSHSFVNGKFSSLGFGLGLVTYEGLGWTLALDYIPLSYAKVQGIPLPSKATGINIATGLNIVIGHKQDKDKDGVQDQFDLCPKTPKKVGVDTYGCPIDSDGDGVPDYLDECPDTPDAAYGYVDERGCPIDTDGDGVPDYKDLCPGTPQEAWGKVDENGCALDSDGDGVPDYLDECPDTPQEAWGYVDSKGCMLDTDGDGVPDYKDECPGTPQEAWGFVDEKGCELDTDHDSVPDWKDKCPDTRKEAIGHVDADGCELDTDGDEVPDWCDECPTVPGVKENKGCPQVKKEIRNLLKKAMQGIQFETGKANIKPKSFPLLNQIAQTFIDNPSYMVEVQGHTDNVGKPAFNMDLSERRAQSVRKYLIEHGVPEKQLTAHGYGDTMPIESNKTAKGRAQNRRVEFVVSFEEVTTEIINDRNLVQPTDSMTVKTDSTTVTTTIMK